MLAVCREGKGSSAKGEGDSPAEVGGRYEGREPSETIPPAEKSRSVYNRTECKVIRKLRELRRE
jgi:hypothetical protein